MQLKWYVLNIRPHAHRTISARLSRYRIEHYWPAAGKPAGSSPSCEPLFSSCIFVRAGKIHQDVLGTIPGIIRFAYWLGRPATIRDEEIDAVRSFLREHPEVTVRRLPVNVRHRQRLFAGEHAQLPAAIPRIFLPSIGFMIIKNPGQPVEGPTTHPEHTHEH